MEMLGMTGYDLSSTVLWSSLELKPKFEVHHMWTRVKYAIFGFGRKR